MSAASDGSAPGAVVYTASPIDIGAAIGRVRARVRALSEPKLYELAFALAVMSRQGLVTSWHSWDTPPPATARRVGRRTFVDALWSLFGTSPSGLLHEGAPVIAQLDGPNRVMIDVFYDAQREPLTLVGDKRIPGTTRNSVKLRLDDPNWLWNPQVSATTAQAAEHNPVNAMNQQNGVRCGLPTSIAAVAAGGPSQAYGVDRRSCEHRVVPADGEPKCLLNDQVCGGQGDGAARETTKPRLLAPPSPSAGEGEYVLLPRALADLVGQATKNGAELPAASDLSLIASWCQNPAARYLDHMRLLSLIGADGLRLLTRRS